MKINKKEKTKKVKAYRSPKIIPNVEDTCPPENDGKSSNRERNEDAAVADVRRSKLKKARENKKNAALTSDGLHKPLNEGKGSELDSQCFSIKRKDKSKKTHKKSKDRHALNEESKSVQIGGVAVCDVYQISSGDDDCSNGMKKWIKEYHENRPGMKVLQQRIDDFIMSHEEKEEQARREREAMVAEEGWTVVVHRKGGKRTTDPESGVAVGSVAEAAVRDKMAKKKSKDVGLDFYRFQRREAKRNEIMELQSKFEEDRKRIQQLRAARKFRPY